MQPQNRTKLILTISSIVFLILLTIGVMGALGFFHSNPFGASIDIDNFSRYFKDVPQEKRDAVSAALYNTITDNLPEGATVPNSGAKIRDRSVDTQYIEASLSNYSTFLVDIEPIQQSYRVQMSWSNNPETTVAGYEILVTCPTEDQLIYPAFECKDMISSDPLTGLYEKDPIMRLLPLKVSYYETNTERLISYRISYKTLEDNTKIQLIIDDYTGGNKENALRTLTEKGVDTTKYDIIYNDESESYIKPGRAPDGA